LRSDDDALGIVIAEDVIEKKDESREYLPFDVGPVGKEWEE
jgi:hypothetical protein